MRLVPNNAIGGLAVALALACAACTDFGLGAPGSGTALPVGGLPFGQTLEGGAQIRVTQAGYTKLVSAHAGAIAQSVNTATSCLAAGSFQATAEIDYCTLNVGTCTPGCALTFDANTYNVTLPNSQTINFAITAPVTTSVRIEAGTPYSTNCTLTYAANLVVDVNIGMSISSSTGELAFGIPQTQNANSSNVVTSGCESLIGMEPSILTNISTEIRSRYLSAVLLPRITSELAAMNPSPSMLAARVDLGAMLVGPSASAGALTETRIGPGGYASFTVSGGGLSLGAITGFNFDADPSTRGTGAVSQPHACVPGLVAPDLGAAPYSLSTTSRGSYLLAPAAEFLGMPEPSFDLVTGVSTASLDLAGHHLVASGALCLTLENSRLAQLRRDALDDLVGVPLGSADAAARAVLKPSQGIRFTLGDGTAASPRVKATLSGLVIDVELHDGAAYLPALRVTSDVTLGFNLDPRRAASAPTQLDRISTVNTVAAVNVEALDARYADVIPDNRLAFAKALVELVFASLGGGAPWWVGDVAGSKQALVSVGRISTSSGDFLSVMGALTDSFPALPAPAPTPSPTEVTVIPGTPDGVRTALKGGGAGLPGVRLKLAGVDSMSRALEHTWRLPGGPWHLYLAGAELTLEDPSFAWQGARTLELRSRVVGDDGTVSEIATVPVTIDFSPPTIFTDQISVNGSVITVPARDSVTSSDTLSRAAGPGEDAAPSTSFAAGETVALGDLASGASVAVYVRDEAGNVARSVFALTPGGGGEFEDPEEEKKSCGCTTGAELVVPLFWLTMLWARRRATSESGVASRQ